MSTSSIVYDSAQPRKPLVSEFRNIWQHRGLIRLLVTRDLTVRYKRSVLGMWWTLLNPLLQILVLWVVFANLFTRPGGDDVPFIVYLSTGILFTTFFSQGIIASGSAIVGARNILDKVYVPPEVFAVAAAIAAGVNFLISIAAIVVVQLWTGVGLQPSSALILVPILSMLLFITGAGMIVASVAVLFYDVFDLVRVIAQIITFASATFYPASIIPANLSFILDYNPVYHHLTLFRGWMYGAEISASNFLFATASSVAILLVGVWIFSRSWRSVVASL